MITASPYDNQSQIGGNMMPQMPMTPPMGVVQPQQPMQQPMMKKGGSVHDNFKSIQHLIPKGFVAVHMNPDEIHELNELQGESIIDPETGYPMFPKIEGAMKHPKMHGYVKKMATHRFAEGGHVKSFNRLKDMGVDGDTEIALVGPHTRRHFDTLTLGGSINPHTGQPQYNILKKAWGGIRGAFGNVFPKMKDLIKRGYGATVGRGSRAAMSGLAGKAGSAAARAAGYENLAPHAETLARDLTSRLQEGKQDTLGAIRDAALIGRETHGNTGIPELDAALAGAEASQKAERAGESTRLGRVRALEKTAAEYGKSGGRGARYAKEAARAAGHFIPELARHEGRSIGLGEMANIGERGLGSLAQEEAARRGHRSTAAGIEAFRSARNQGIGAKHAAVAGVTGAGKDYLGGGEHPEGYVGAALRKAEQYARQKGYGKTASSLGAAASGWGQGEKDNPLHAAANATLHGWNRYFDEPKEGYGGYGEDVNPFAGMDVSEAPTQRSQKQRQNARFSHATTIKSPGASELRLQKGLPSFTAEEGPAYEAAPAEPEGWMNWAKRRGKNALNYYDYYNNPFYKQGGPVRKRKSFFFKETC